MHLLRNLLLPAVLRVELHLRECGKSDVETDKFRSLVCRETDFLGSLCLELYILLHLS